MTMNPTILLTFDVEDWFQVENLRGCFPFSSWPDCELRVEKNVHRILDLLDSVDMPRTSSLTTNATIKATFFVLGWLAERLPHLVIEIKKRGHEIASHGYDHVLCKEQPADELRVDLVKSKGLLEDITGAPIHGYRAPGFSVGADILNKIEEAGYIYDSSFNSFRLNKRYGQLEGMGNNHHGMVIQVSDTFYELPISNLSIGKHALPWGGGGYFRLFPFSIFKQGVQSILKKQGAYLFYLHPWEIDPDQPRVSRIPPSYRLRHYLNLNKTAEKFNGLLKSLKNCKFQTCYEYLKEKYTTGLKKTLLFSNEYLYP